MYTDFHPFLLGETHRVHVWHIYLHLVDFYGINVGKHTSPMDPMGTNPIIDSFIKNGWAGTSSSGPPKTGGDVKWFVSTDRKDHANHAHDPEVGFWGIWTAWLKKA